VITADGVVDELGQHPDKPSLAWNSAVLVAAQIVTAVLGTATLLVVSRLLGPTALGEWRFAVALTGYLLVVSDAGLSALAVREIARERTLTPQLGWPVVLVQAGVAGVLYVLLIAGLLLSGMSGRAFAVVALLGLSAFVHALGIGHVFQAYERMSTLALVSVLSGVTATTVGLAVLAATRQLVWLAVVPVVIGVIGNIVLLRLGRRAFELPFSLPRPHAALALLHSGAPFLVIAIATQLIFSADAILIEIFRGAHELGIYAAGYAIPAQLLLITGPLMAAVYPRLSTHGAAGSATLTAAIAGVLGFLVLPLALGGATVSDQLVRLLYGGSFHRSGPILAIAMSLPALGAFNSVLGQALAARRRQHTVMRVALITAAFNVAANLALLPTVGIVGAAIAVAASEVLTLVSFAVADRGIAIAAGREYAPNLVHAAVAAGAVLAARALWSTSLGANVAIGVVVYVVITLVLPTAGARRVKEALIVFRQSRGR
jgi:O-antigen/teichoic acid export membrane protein